MQIRKIGEEDLEMYRELRLSALKSADAQAFGGNYEEEASRTREDWLKRFNDPYRMYLGYFVDEALVATAGAFYGEDKDVWVIVGVYTKPEYRKQGIAHSLVEAVIVELRKQDIKRVILYVNMKQEQAVSLYKTLGFKQFDIVKDFEMGDGQLHDEYVMEKDI